MDKKRRATIRSCIEKLNDVLFDVVSVRETEEICFDNMPDNLQHSEDYYKREDIIDELSMGEDNISDAVKNLENAVK